MGTFMHLSAVVSRLYKLFENRKKVYSKIKFEEKYKILNFEKNPLKFIKMEKSPQNVIINGTDQEIIIRHESYCFFLFIYRRCHVV